MKKVFFIIFAAASMLMLANCSKNEVASEATPSMVQGKLISSSIVKSVDLEEFVNGVLISAVDTIKPKITDLFNGFITGAKWEIETFRIQYASIANDGKPAILSGDISFICDGTHKINKRLNSVSLFHIMFNLNQGTTEMQKDYATLRVLHNALVVCPLYQGAAIDKGKHIILTSEPFVKAQQAIDCELAALELIDQLDYVHIDRDYYTENMGLSNGASVSLATQYLLEQKSTAEVQNKIRLAATFCGSGCYDYGTLVSTGLNLRNLDEVSSSVKGMLPYALVGCIAGTCDTWLKTPAGPHVALLPPQPGTHKVEEYLSEACKSGIFRGEPYSIIDHLFAGDLNMAFMDMEGMDFSNMAPMDATDYEDYDWSAFYIPTIFEEVIVPYTYRGIFNKHNFVGDNLEEGNVDYDKPHMKALFDAFDKSNFLLLDWTPSTPVRIAHSMDDDMLPFAAAENEYNNLSRNGWNRNVSFFKLHGLDHGMSATVECALVGLLPHPCPLR